MTRNNGALSIGIVIVIATNLHPLTNIHWRASLVPAAAVIPAPIAYIKVVAVKKLVVGFLQVARLLPCGKGESRASFCQLAAGLQDLEVCADVLP